MFSRSILAIAGASRLACMTVSAFYAAGRARKGYYLKRPVDREIESFNIKSLIVQSKCLDSKGGHRLPFFRDLKYFCDDAAPSSALLQLLSDLRFYNQESM